MPDAAARPAPTRPPGALWGDLLGRLPVALAAAVAAVCALAVPLVLLDAWRPWTAVPVVLVLGALAARIGWQVPAPAAPRWAVLLTLGVAAGHALWAGATRAEHLVLRRDAGSLANYAHHLSVHGGLPVDPSLRALGGPEALADPNVTVASPAFYEVGTGADVTVVPQFLLGAPALFSLGEWAGGWTGLLLVPALLSGAAVLAVAGLAGRLVGVRWAPLAAAVTALAQPVLHAARSTYSEPPALLLLAAAAALLAAACASRGTTAARLGGGAGLLFGGAGFVRVDALREVLLLLPVVAVLLVRRHPAARALLAGAVATTVLSGAAAVALSRPYLATIWGSLLPLLALTVLVALGCAVAVRLARGGFLARVGVLRSPRLPDVVAGLLAVVLLGLASRPLWLVVRQDPEDPGAKLVAGLQQRQDLPVDGGRTYAEHSVDWVAWYLGWPAVVVAAVVAVVLLRRLVAALRSGAELPAWSGPFAVALGSVLLTLYRPGITPDHPWADRRLVPVVLPAVVLLSVAGLAAALRWVGAWRAGELRAGRVPARLVPVVAGVGAVLLLAPAAAATAPVAGLRTERGQVAAVRTACRAFSPGDVALAVDSRARNEWPQVLRGVCGVPAASIVVPSRLGRPGSPAVVQAQRAAIDRAARRVREAGGRPVLVAADDPASLVRLGVPERAVRQAVRISTTEDERVLEERPDGAQRIHVGLWLAEAPGG
ncbi:hypothetical protein CLV92_103312 [Kineococcus xinjiangensis]|uniref:Dolichyl-phosphate-mannose-protein mannosyltransferase n=1 Tax=Kineococcus xinjiangensis TaxID=512762 RepID=A0A2S6IU47_9ACTN|nr:hypothetical protein [Kineococcus xinjiangensis]PPK97777.1 hypothetical protein CLV92_103312 [Kineococcus xinjiangensis]